MDRLVKPGGDGKEHRLHERSDTQSVSSHAIIMFAFFDDIGQKRGSEDSGMPKPITVNTLFYGDNLDILREYVADELVDLVYLDPPFNSNATYNVLFRAPTGEQSQAQIEAFGDTWHWNVHAEEAFDQVIHSENSDAAEMLRAMRSFLKENDMMAYLAMMAVRLLELHRVLKPSGALYLHCDPTASHYLELLLDSIFGPHNFLNEVIWKRTGTHSSARRWGPVHDVIFYYAKAESEHVWNRPYVPLSEKHLETHYRKIDERSTSKGVDMNTVNSLERARDEEEAVHRAEASTLPELVVIG